METTSSIRPHTLQDFVAIWRRRRWHFLATSAIGAALTCAVVGFLPSYYRSEALVLVEQSEVSQEYVKPVVAVDNDQQLSALIQDVMSRTVLERMPFFKTGTASKEDDFKDFQKNASIELLRDNSDPRRPAGKPYGLKVSFLGDKPEQAQEVTNELAALTIQENDKMTLAQAQATTRMLRSQLGAATAKVKEKEQALDDFRTRHAGQLPIEEQLTIETLSHLEAELDGESQAIQRTRQDIADMQTTAPQAPAVENKKSTDQQDASAARLQADLQALKDHLAELESRYKATHPDVIRAKEEIKRLETQLATEAAKESTSKQNQPIVNTSQSTTATAVHVRNSQAELAARIAKQGKLEQKIAQYQANLAAIPSHAQEFGDLQRDYEAAKKDAESLRDKVTDAEQSTEVFQQQEGVRLRIQDYATLPASAELPVRWKINLAGLAGGIVLGLVLAGFLEIRDTSMKSEADMEFYTGLKSLALLPELPTAVELNRARRRRYVGITAAVIVSLVLASVNYFAYLGRH